MREQQAAENGEVGTTDEQPAHRDVLLGHEHDAADQEQKGGDDAGNLVSPRRRYLEAFVERLFHRRAHRDDAARGDERILGVLAVN